MIDDINQISIGVRKLGVRFSFNSYLIVECKTEGKLLLQSSSRQKSRDRVSRVDSTRSHSHSKLKLAWWN